MNKNEENMFKSVEKARLTGKIAVREPSKTDITLDKIKSTAYEDAYFAEDYENIFSADLTIEDNVINTSDIEAQDTISPEEHIPENRDELDNLKQDVRLEHNFAQTINIESEKSYPQSTVEPLRKAASEDSRTSDFSGHIVASDSDGNRTSESSEQKATIDTQEFYIKTRVDSETAKISLSISRLRPKTYLGRSQGAHITSYIVYVTAILETVDGHNIHEIPALLVAMAKSFIPDNHWKALDEKIAVILNQNTASTNRESHKEITKTLRKNNIKEEVVQSIKKAIKVQYASFISNIIDMLSTEVLKIINKDRTALFLRHKKKSSKALGSKGALIRSTMLNLRAAEYIIKWKLTGTDDQTNEEILTELLKGKLRQGLKTFMPQEKQKNNNLSDADINAFLDAIYENEASFAAILPIIGQNILQLFDFNYFEYKISLLLETELPPTEKAEFILLLNNPSAEKAFQEINKNKEMKLDTTALDYAIIASAPKIIRRHLEIILFHAFPMLSRLEPHYRLNILENFFIFFQNSMHWPKEVITEIEPNLLKTILKNYTPADLSNMKNSI